MGRLGVCYLVNLLVLCLGFGFGFCVVTGCGGCLQFEFVYFVISLPLIEVCGVRCLGRTYSTREGSAELLSSR